MEGFPPSSAEDDVVINWTSNEFDLQSLEDIFNIPEPLSYVILKHILSKDDSLQFSYSSVFSIIPKKTIMSPQKKSRSPPEVPDNQSSILCNDQGGQNNVSAPICYIIFISSIF